MKNYIIYNNNGKILRIGSCSDDCFNLKAQKDELIIEGSADDCTQKVVNDKVVDKTPEEIASEQPPDPDPIPHEKQVVFITNEQWQSVLDRLIVLENNEQEHFYSRRRLKSRGF